MKTNDSLPENAKGDKPLLVLVVIGVIAIVLVIVVAITFASSPGKTPQTSATTPVPSSVHEHIWMPIQETRHQDAITHDEWREPVVAQVTNDHTVCNVCRSRIEGKTAEHAAQTGHTGYTTGIPITDEVIAAEGHWVTITDTPAKDEVITARYKCSVCGEEKAQD